MPTVEGRPAEEANIPSSVVDNVGLRAAAMYTTSFAFFEALWEAGVSHCFVNLGSDHPGMIEAMVKGQRETPDRFPKIITCPNEMVALSAAHGMALTTGHPQAVIVHVDVGTQGLGAAVHNASCGRVPVLIFAGLSPFTLEGELRGSRTEFIHWTQDVPDQRAILSQYCRYTGEIKTGKNVKQIVNRALQFAMSDPTGPVYLMGAREVMEEEIEPYFLDQGVWGPIEAGALPEGAAERIVDAVLDASEPLIIVGYSGRKWESVGELVKFADAVPGVRVLDTLGSDMCFPANHRSAIGMTYGVHERIKTADFILVLDCDIPWIPTICKPSPTAKIFHIDIDPLKQQMTVFYIPALARYRADATTALEQLNEYIASKKSSLSLDLSKNIILETEHAARMQRLEDAAAPLEDGRVSCAHLIRSVRNAIPEDSVVLVEAVTQTATVLDQLRSVLPGSILNSGGGGLGWFGGAACGAKLGLDNGVSNSGKFVAAIVGDGTFLFSVPASVYWISRRYGIPFLTVVLNNKGNESAEDGIGWNAPLKSVKLIHPNGYAATATNEECNISFAPSPDYTGIAKASAGGDLWAGIVKTGEELAVKLVQAVEAVKGGQSAVLEVYIV
ncbi:hypothetical protein RUND412_000161 [Rhizina undulata]